MPVQVGKQKTLELVRLRPHRRTECHQRSGAARGVGIWRHGGRDGGAGGVNHVVHLRRPHAADGFVQHAPIRQAGVVALRVGDKAREQGHLGHLLQRQQARAHAVVDVVRVVGNGVGQVGQLRLQAGLRAVDEAARHAAGLGRVEQSRVGRRAVFEDAFARLESQVQAVVVRVAVLQLIDHAQALQVVLEAAVRGHAVVERILPGVAEGRVAEVVGQRDGFGQIFVQPQRAGDGAGKLRYLQRMREPGAEQVALVVQEHLRFVDQPPERGGVHDAVAVALEVVARGRRRDRMAPAARLGRVAGVGGQGHGRGTRCALRRPGCNEFNSCLRLLYMDFKCIRT